ncbi:sulfite exporter TauE/SafE family protein [Palleniella muris]|uniref:Sulfite exporter TauE/SafE family protein n=1 Tax=Palleniella muris TaxID=3038145 RepID=A0AC61QN51_9BACT|nr:aromatic aminobenezylarsenical efflux permease ArsG family transporter [Palleniella muris]TGX80968.1 sulfite exporter TauE/SafE family protein [Palleniella muris]
MEFLQQLSDNSQVPVLTAFLLGLLTALSPCPLANNITAIAFIARKSLDGGKSSGVLWSGVLYAVGRCMAYTGLGALLIYIIRTGADTFSLQQTISEWGEAVLGPALVLIGLLMLASEFVSFGGKFGFSAGEKTERLSGPVGSLLLGILFAMAFCPTSGLFYFGMLIPMSAAESGGYLLPLVFAIATALPVLLVAWLLAFSVSSMGRAMGKINAFQRWFNRIVALVFIIVGINYCYTYFIA